MLPSLDLTGCDTEPIHLSGAIQPHGALLVCDRQGQVVCASANFAAFTGVAGAAPPVGGMLSDLLGDKLVHDLRNAAARAGGTETPALLAAVTLPGAPGRFDAAIHTYLGRTFVELERASDAAGPDPLDVVSALMRRLDGKSGVEGLARTAARLVRGMLGYDRVMVYRFLHNGAGQVIAEARDSRLNSFMGQHFPASDLPAQARRLYLANTIRMIGDAGYGPVPLLPEAEAEAVDLSYAGLRSVSPVHCAYLRNMGVAASLSISIVCDGVLWGLVACHHDSPRLVPLRLRHAAELFGHYLSLRIDVAERQAQEAAACAARTRLAALVRGFDPDVTPDVALAAHLPELMALLDCQGAGLWIGGTWTRRGAAPAAAEVPALVRLAAEEGPIFSTHDLNARLGAAFGTEVAGMIAIPISSIPRDYLLLFRSEEAHAIAWAGVPEKIEVEVQGGVRLTPRGSFEVWREEVRGRARPWTAGEVAVAGAIHAVLRDVMLHHSEVTADERSRAEARRRLLNDELNHRVKNILALVRSIVGQTRAHAGSVTDYAESLQGRLGALALAHDQSLSGAGGELIRLLEAETMSHRHPGWPDRITLSGPPVAFAERAFGVLALVVHELATNAAKYGALSVPEGRLKVTWSLAANGDCRIEWRESGGPPVRPPSRTGFGTRLLGSTVAYDLGGVVDSRFEPTGLIVRIAVPATYLAPVRPQVPDAAAAGPDPGLLVGARVLLVEDQGLIAIDTEEALLGLGVEEVRAVPDVMGAHRLLRVFTPDFAVLDFNLGTQTAAEIADVLMLRQIPFVFATGYGDGVTIPARFRAVPVVRKPVDPSDLVRAVERAGFCRAP